jgi:hypothetical protein
MSTGSRVFSPTLLPSERDEPLDPTRLRELVAALVPNDVPEEAGWLDGGATVQATVRAGGRFEPRFGRQRHDREVVVIEDVAASMTRWPLHGVQLARSIAARARTCTRLYMRGEPMALGVDRELRATRPLAEILDAHPDAAVIVISDASRLDTIGCRRRARWVDLLERATWLHPRPRALWDDGVRWLHERIRVVSLVDDRPVAPRGRAGRAPLETRWHAPEPVTYAATDLVATWRLCLDAAAFSALSCAALLARARCLNTRLFWMMIADGLPQRGRLAQLDRIWDLPAIEVRPSGTISVPMDAALLLAGRLAREERGRAQAVVAWLERLVARTDFHGEDSAARAQARVHIARLVAAANMRGQARRLFVELRREGLLELFSPQLSVQERARWRTRSLFRRPSRVRAVAGAALLTLGLWASVRFRHAKLMECRFPAPAVFSFKARSHPDYSEDAEIAITASPPRACPLRVFIDGGHAADLPHVQGGWEDNWTLHVGTDCCQTARAYAFQVGFSDTNLSTPITIRVSDASTAAAALAIERGAISEGASGQRQGPKPPAHKSVPHGPARHLSATFAYNEPEMDEYGIIGTGELNVPHEDPRLPTRTIYATPGGKTGGEPETLAENDDRAEDDNDPGFKLKTYTPSELQAARRNAEGEFRRGVILIKNRQYPAAIEVLNKSRDLVEKKCDVDYALADAYRLGGQPREALEAYRSYLGSMPERRAALSPTLEALGRQVLALADASLGRVPARKSLDLYQLYIWSTPASEKRPDLEQKLDDLRRRARDEGR